MEDYPRTLLELEARFRDEESCRAYLFALRWPDGFVCPRCQRHRASPMGRGLWLCLDCEAQISLIAGTIFHRTRLPLRLWFRAIWYVTSQKNGASALGVQRVLGLGSYQTAWSCLHKLRRAMVRPGRERLHGRVEVDEVFIGGKETGFEGRSAPAKALVAIAAEKDGEKIGRIRMYRIRDAKKPTLHRFIETMIAPGSVVCTDGWTSYLGLEEKGYGHEIITLEGKPPALATTAMPRVHRISSLLKRWLLGTHHGAVRASHLDYYLDEFTFRFNRRTSLFRGKLFYRLLQQAVQVGPTSFRKTTHNR